MLNFEFTHGQYVCSPECDSFARGVELYPEIWVSSESTPERKILHAVKEYRLQKLLGHL
jgi:hypothetical protein